MLTRVTFPFPFSTKVFGVYATFSCDLVMRRASPQDFGINMPRKRQARPGLHALIRHLKVNHLKSDPNVRALIWIFYKGAS